jgi:hypothetical protein
MLEKLFNAICQNFYKHLTCSELKYKQKAAFARCLV